MKRKLINPPVVDIHSPGPPLTTQEATVWLRCSVDWVADHAHEVGGIRAGGRWLFPRRALCAYLGEDVA